VKSVWETNLKKQPEADFARIDKMTDDDIDTSNSPASDERFSQRRSGGYPAKKTAQWP
jgi:hypothetical protein